MRDAEAGWGGGWTEAATANPNSLSRAAINIPVFPKRGRRLSSSAPAQKEDGGKINGDSAPNPRGPGWGGQRRCGKGGVHPKVGALLLAPKRDNSFAAKAPGGRHKPRPPAKGLSTTVYQPPESPHAGTGEKRAAAPRQGHVSPDPTVPANRKSPLPLPPCQRHRMGPKSAAAGRPFLPAARSRARDGSCQPPETRRSAPPPGAYGCSEPAGLRHRSAVPIHSLAKATRQDPAPG